MWLIPWYEIDFKHYKNTKDIGIPTGQMENEIQNTFRIFYLKIFPSEFCLLMYTYMYETEKKI